MNDISVLLLNFSKKKKKKANYSRPTYNCCGKQSASAYIAFSNNFYFDDFADSIEDTLFANDIAEVGILIFMFTLRYR